MPEKVTSLNGLKVTLEYGSCLANVEMSCSKQVRDDVWESLENSFFSLSQAWRMVADARLSQ